MVPCERSCHKKYTYEIYIFNSLKVMAKVKVFVLPSDTDVDTRAMALASLTFAQAH